MMNMHHKQIGVLLFACLVIISFISYQQAKTIDNMEWSISHLEDRVNTLEEKVKDLESEIEEMKPSIESLQEEMEEHFPRPSYNELRQATIARIRRFNAAREKEKDSGAVNTPAAVAKERQTLYMLRKYYNIDIELK